MGTCRFVLTNLAQTATVKNGSGGGPPTPPVRSEVAPFVMERALNGDRRSLWKAGATNDTVGFTCYQMDLDLGAAQFVNCAVFHNLYVPAGSLVSAGIGYLNSYPSTYTLLGGVASFNGRDSFMLIAPVTKRYWALAIEATASPVLGRFVLGTLVDLGVAPNPGYESSPHQNRLEQVGDDGSVVLNVLGQPGHDFSLSFDPCTLAVRLALETVAAHPGTATYIDPDDRCFEVIVRGGKLGISRLNPSMFSATLEMTRVP